MEKPLVDKLLSTREKNEKFFKRSLIVSLVKQTTVMNRSRRDLGMKKMSIEVAVAQQQQSTNEDSRKLERLNLAYDDYDLLTNLETFGTSATTPKTQKLLTAEVKTESNSKVVKEIEEAVRPLEKEIRNENQQPNEKPSPKKRLESDDTDPYDLDDDDESADQLMIAVDEDKSDVEKKKLKKDMGELNSPSRPNENVVTAVPIISKVIPIEKKESEIQPKAASQVCHKYCLIFDYNKKLKL